MVSARNTMYPLWLVANAIHETLIIFCRCTVSYHRVFIDKSFEDSCFIECNYVMCILICQRNYTYILLFVLMTWSMFFIMNYSQWTYRLELTWWEWVLPSIELERRNNKSFIIRKICLRSVKNSLLFLVKHYYVYNIERNLLQLNLK